MRWYAASGAANNMITFPEIKLRHLRLTMSDQPKKSKKIQSKAFIRQQIIYGREKLNPPAFLY